MAVINLFDETGDNRFITVNDMLDNAKKIEDYKSGLVVLVNSTGRDSLSVRALSSNLDIAQINLVLDLLKQQLIGEGFEED